MPTWRRALPFRLPSLPFVLLFALLTMLFVAGGASRPDVAGQTLARAAATLIILIAIIFGPQPSFLPLKPVWIVLAAAMLLCALQLIPLPHTLWQALAGRAPFADAVGILGESQPWRPLSLVPGATLNAVGSLLIPLATLIVFAQLTEREQRQSLGVVLIVGVASMLVGLVQFSGIALIPPFGDNDPMAVSGFFANRNHFATFLAIGCALAAVWARLGQRGIRQRGVVALGLVILFFLCVLGSGSRAGLAISLVAIAAGLSLVASEIRRELLGFPKWVPYAAIGTIAAIIGGFTALSFFADRATSATRALEVGAAMDLRIRALPTNAAIAGIYFPAGTGFGSFATVYNVHEPLSLLGYSYLNHVHNDFLEVVIEGGIGGLLLLAGAIVWWGRASWRAWRAEPRQSVLMARAGSISILLVMLASVVDYPARTPLFMAVLALAACWLASFSANYSPPLRSGSKSI